jgi:hypothetical protein
MANIWEKFNQAYDVKNLANEVAEAEANGDTGTFEEVPHGTYDVEINKMELKLSKNNNPMLSVWFKVLAGASKGSLIFMNQVITQKFQIHITNEFLRSLDSGLDIKFIDYGQYEQLIMDVHEAIDGKLEYGLKYGETKKGFSTFDITDVYEAE